MAVDIYAGKGVIDVGNYIFSFYFELIIHTDMRRGSGDLDTDDSVGGLWSPVDPSWL